MAELKSTVNLAQGSTFVEGEHRRKKDGCEQLQSFHSYIRACVHVSTSPRLAPSDPPDMTGADAAKAICKDQRTAGIPIVGCSAYLGLEWRKVALRAGMVDYLEKPISAAAIEAVVEQLILSENAAA